MTGAARPAGRPSSRPARLHRRASSSLNDQMLSYRPIVTRLTTPQLPTLTGPQDQPALTPTLSVSGRPTSTSYAN